MVFLPCFFYFFSQIFIFIVCVSISVVKKCPASAVILVFLSRILKVQTYNIFYFILNFSVQITSSFTNIQFIFFDLNFLCLDKWQFLPILFDLFVCPIFFQALRFYFSHCFLSYFLYVQIYNLFYLTLIFCIQMTSSFYLFYFVYFFLQCFFRYLFLIFMVVFFCYLLEVQTYNFFFFMLIFCIYITSTFQLFDLISFFGGTNI